MDENPFVALKGKAITMSAVKSAFPTLDVPGSAGIWHNSFAPNRNLFCMDGGKVDCAMQKDGNFII